MDNLTMVPRRHRSLVYKLVVAIPLLWIVLLMFFYNEKKTTVEAVPKGEVGGRKVQAQARVVEATPTTQCCLPHLTMLLGGVEEEA